MRFAGHFHRSKEELVSNLSLQFRRIDESDRFMTGSQPDLVRVR